MPQSTQGSGRAARSPAISSKCGLQWIVQLLQEFLQRLQRILQLAGTTLQVLLQQSLKFCF